MKSRRVPQEAVIIGRNLRTLRRRNGLTQKDVAFMLGVTFQQIQKYERGENRLPLDKLHLLKNHFAVPYEFFFHGLIEEEGQGEWPENISASLARIKHPALQDKIRRVIAIMME